MSHTIKLALYTDFSKESRVTLDTIIFNTWGFDFDLDVLCILKDDNIRETLEKLEELKKELNYHLEEGHSVTSKVFLHGEEDLFMNHINRESYFCLLIGIADSKINWNPGSIFHDIFNKAKVDLSLVPLKHEVKIENRGIISLELKNLEKIHTLKRVMEYLKFYYAKIKLILITDDLLSNDKTKEVTEFVSTVLPELNLEIINFKKTQCEEAILNEVLESPIDYFLYFNDDYLEDLIQDKLQAALLPGIHEFSLVKMYVNEEILENLKFEQIEMPKVQLNKVAEKNHF